MSITKEQFHRAKYDLKMDHEREGGDPCIYDWQLIHYPGVDVLKVLFVDGAVMETELTKYQRDYPRKELNGADISL